MRYISTRGQSAPQSFCDILLGGLAPDGGLYLPVAYPQVDDATLTRWRGLSYADLAFEILSLFIDDIPAADLKALVAKTYTKAVFGTEAIVPVRKLGGFFRAADIGVWPTQESTSMLDAAACALPALRASRTDPAAALRSA